jgi:hypothetical protein
MWEYLAMKKCTTWQRKAATCINQIPEWPTGKPKTLIKARQKIQWREETDGYQVDKDSIHQLERNAQVTIYRLRTGHCRLHHAAPEENGTPSYKSLQMWAQRADA